MAISQIVPAWHIFEMLAGKKFKTQRQKADGNLMRETRTVDDQKVRDFLRVPKGKKKTIKADGSTQISNVTDNEKTRLKFLISLSEELKPTQQ
jgi:hypothetical protein